MSFTKSIVDDLEVRGGLDDDSMSVQDIFTIQAFDGLEPPAVDKLVSQIDEYPQSLTSDIIRGLSTNESGKVLDALREHDSKEADRVRNIIDKKTNDYNNFIDPIINLNHNIPSVEHSIPMVNASIPVVNPGVPIVCDGSVVDVPTDKDSILSGNTIEDYSSSSLVSSSDSSISGGSKRGRKNKKSSEDESKTGSNKESIGRSKRLSPKMIDPDYVNNIFNIMSAKRDKSMGIKDEIRKRSLIQDIINLSSKFNYSKNGREPVKASDFDTMELDEIEGMYGYLKELNNKQKRGMQMFLLIQILFSALENLSKKTAIIDLSGLSENLKSIELVEKELDTLDKIHESMFGSVGRSDNPFINLGLVLAQPICMTLLQNHITGKPVFKES